MLDNKGFDNWSGAYDQDILKMQDEGYPFEGYYDTLGYIQNQVQAGGAKTVLDIGIGTGLLTETLYKAGIAITGVDFSTKMLDLARTRMPQGRFVQFDFNQGLPKELAGETFDFIVSSYAVHHIDDKQKVTFFRGLVQHLNDEGQVLIGDVAFETQRDMENVRAQSTGWDNAEYYMIAETMIRELAKHQLRSEFVKTSSCSGVLVIQRQ
ncbi:MAG: class I SAM-dependent methyltransferase [Chloroflexi bacterium]|nr:class I SAM-dependent methyltransferase [Chloroflexota bacterium]